MVNELLRVSQRLRLTDSVNSGLNQGLRGFFILIFLNGACLFKVEVKEVLKYDQASSAVGMRFILCHCTSARSYKKASSLKFFSRRL